jgi:signal transduction histidine kinase
MQIQAAQLQTRKGLMNTLHVRKVNGSLGPRSRTITGSAGRGRCHSEATAAVDLSQKVETPACVAVIEERNRIAREVHDTLAQQFAGILLLLEAVKRFDGAELQNAPEFLARARELAKCGLEDARRMLLGLRPKSLEGANLSAVLKQLAERFSHDCGIQCTFNENGRAHSLPQKIEDELYRVAQEALCNVRKHSRAASVSIFLSYRSDGVTLAIKDNGQGFVAAQSQAGTHGFGLPAMRDRARNVGGRMDISTAPGIGTELSMTVPLSGKTSKERKY